MTAGAAEEAEAYHARQLGVFARSEADMATAMTMTYVEEALGVCRAAAGRELPCAIAFTVETDGRLPSGQPLSEAIEQVDADDAAPAYFMVDCAHPSHLAPALADGGDWTRRILGLRANASTMSHAELDEATELDDGDPVALGAAYGDLRVDLPALTVLGGCCGTDERHVAQARDAWLGLEPARPLRAER